LHEVNTIMQAMMYKYFVFMSVVLK